MPQSFSERRQVERIAFHAPLRFRVRGKRDFDCAVSEDLSVSGLGFITSDFLAAGTSLMLDMTLPCRTISPIAKVAWCSPMAHSDRNRTGLEFLEMGAKDRDCLKEFISLQK